MSGDDAYQELSTEDCLALLEANRFGRVGVVVAAKPMVFPVNYLLDGDTIVFRTGVGSKLSGAALGHVCFEIDGIDETRRSGWSVIVHGVGHEITEAIDQRSAHLRQLEVEPWVPGEHAHWVAIQPDSITGRRLEP
jgi:nitroimidazol reductase NimA-like FMN-containing flavoprotein (pyridoxamine 5'-phosphate oxidase superfamily)